MAIVNQRAFPRLALSAVLACLAAGPLVVAAQSGPATGAVDARGASIRQQMSAEEFAAAGLDKLSADELGRLDAWLNRTVTVETEKAAVAERRRVEDNTRGFFNFGSSEPVAATLDGAFRGFRRGREYTLDNGQVWQQVDDATLAGANLERPKVTITPSLVGNAWYMSVPGYNTRAKVVRIR